MPRSQNRSTGRPPLLLEPPGDVPVPTQVTLDPASPALARPLFLPAALVAVPKVAVAEHGDLPAPASKVWTARHLRVRLEPGARPGLQLLRLEVDRGAPAAYARHGREHSPDVGVSAKRASAGPRPHYARAAVQAHRACRAQGSAHGAAGEPTRCTRRSVAKDAPLRIHRRREPVLDAVSRSCRRRLLAWRRRLHGRLWHCAGQGTVLLRTGPDARRQRTARACRRRGGGAEPCSRCLTFCRWTIGRQLDVASPQLAIAQWTRLGFFGCVGSRGGVRRKGGIGVRRRGGRAGVRAARSG